MTLAQRMIVMNAGAMEQIGTPEQVYLEPATAFVASFIGSPPMNLLDGEARGGRFESGGATLALPVPAPREGTLILGVRPEHCALGADGAPAGAAARWTLKVEMLEMLGAERLVYGRLGGSAFTVRTDGTAPPPAPGANVELVVDQKRLHWFDAATRRRVS